jgi:hypothetical protein
LRNRAFPRAFVRQSVPRRELRLGSWPIFQGQFSAAPSGSTVSIFGAPLSHADGNSDGNLEMFRSASVRSIPRFVGNLARHELPKHAGGREKDGKFVPRSRVRRAPDAGSKPSHHCRDNSAAKR